MTERQIRAFIKRLERAREAVRRGDTGCQAHPTKCWSCAMRYRSGVKPLEEQYPYTGPENAWSFERPKSDTLALFDNSIAALRSKHSQRQY